MENILEKNKDIFKQDKMSKVIDRIRNIISDDVDTSCIIEKNTLWLTICHEHSLMLINAILCDSEGILDVRVTSPEENTTTYVFQFKD